MPGAPVSYTGGLSGSLIANRIEQIGKIYRAVDCANLDRSRSGLLLKGLMAMDLIGQPQPDHHLFTMIVLS